MRRSGPRLGGPSVGGGAPVVDASMTALRDVWEATSFELEKLQCNPVCVAQEQAGLPTRHAPSWMEEDLGHFAGWQGRALASRDGLRGAGFDEGLDGFVPGFDEFEMAYDPWGRTWGLAGLDFE